MPDLKRLFFAFAASVLAFTAMPAFAQQEVQDPPPVWSHRVLNVPFPDKIGDFVRGRVVEYDAEGSDASVGYDLIRGDSPIATVTLYVYPSGGLGCLELYQGAQAAITGRYSAVKLLEEARRPSPNGSSANAAYFSRYSFEIDLTGNGAQRANSDLYVWCTPDEASLVKYRATYREGLVLDREITELLRAIHWPPPLDR